MPYEITYKIKEIRANLNLSQERFGKKIGLSAKTISAYETGKILPSYKILESISREYGVAFIGSEKKQLIERKLSELEIALEEVRKLIY
jgi:transcriptional regulator with XRE-family HTH domain